MKFSNTQIPIQYTSTGETFQKLSNIRQVVGIHEN